MELSRTHAETERRAAELERERDQALERGTALAAELRETRVAAEEAARVAATAQKARSSAQARAAQAHERAERIAGEVRAAKVAATEHRQRAARLRHELASLHEIHRAAEDRLAACEAQLAEARAREEAAAPDAEQVP